jgi:ribulose-5-phosphate 4-epimerase/fuculose-1-phosphate aldolase
LLTSRSTAIAFEIPSLKDSVHPDEWQLRLDLAACYRLVALYGWSDLVFTHISTKLPHSVAGDAGRLLRRLRPGRRGVGGPHETATAAVGLVATVSTAAMNTASANTVPVNGALVRTAPTSAHP